MEVRISPAVVVVVLVLVASILVGLYFTVIAKSPAQGSSDIVSPGPGAPAGATLPADQPPAPAARPEASGTQAPDQAADPAEATPASLPADKPLTATAVQ